jgi:hypothetical protein
MHHEQQWLFVGALSHHSIKGSTILHGAIHWRPVVQLVEQRKISGNLNESLVRQHGLFSEFDVNTWLSLFFIFLLSIQQFLFARDAVVEYVEEWYASEALIFRLLSLCAE